MVYLFSTLLITYIVLIKYPSSLTQSFNLVLLFQILVLFFQIGEGNLIFCCTGSQDNCFRLVSQQNNNDNPKF